MLDNCQNHPNLRERRGKFQDDGVQYQRKEKVLVTQSFPTLQPHDLQPARLLSPWDSPDQNTGVGSHSLLQGIFLTQGSNPGLLHCGQILYHQSHQEEQISKYKSIEKILGRLIKVLIFFPAKLFFLLMLFKDKGCYIMRSQICENMPKSIFFVL